MYLQANQKLTKKHMLKEYAGEIESLRSMLQVRTTSILYTALCL
jgi:hypothetical protein